ncbi:adenosylmethionine-8-amino-7-oxononanoate aminotransferase [Cellulomonas sp. SLBN-39]|nr:adenosylmethionine-8-amino-7-oxononanoate aminotransferase [Cellulomonas sp. SLBN-39]
MPDTSPEHARRTLPCVHAPDDALPSTPDTAPAGWSDPGRLRSAAARHLWPHFTPADQAARGDLPVFVRGEGVEMWDADGKRWLDGLAALFTVQVGHGRRDLLQKAVDRAGDLAYFPLWGAANAPAVELAERLAHLAPGDLDRVFFGTGGGDSVEAAWKLARSYFAAVGKPRKYKVLSRVGAYHGTSLGALSITGMTGIRHMYEPLVPGAVKVPSTNLYRAPVHADDPVAFGAWAADQVEATILAEGPDTVAAIFLEPVQNAGGSLLPPPGYLQRVREICDRHDVLLVSDETICGFGRTGAMFGCERFDVVPDMITCAKGLTSGYAVLSAVIASERIFEAFRAGGGQFVHGNTWGGHPVAAATALANLDLFDELGLVEHVAATEGAFGDAMRGLGDLELVGDVRGVGHFWTVEVVADRATRRPIVADADGRHVADVIRAAVLDAGLHCRVFGSGSSVIQLCPPLISDQGVFDEIEQVLRAALEKGAAAC